MKTHNSTAMVVALFLLGAQFSTFSLAQQRRATRSSATTDRSNEKSVEKGKEASPPLPGLPFRMEVGLSSDPQQVVLAVDAVTAFHCPEAVLQVIFGDKTGLGLAESVEGTPRSDFYIRPTRAGVLTNVFIEMRAATVTLQLRTIEVRGGPRLGTYNGEIFVRLPGYHDELAQSKTIINALQNDLAACGAERENQKQRSARAEAQAISETEEATVKEAIRALADLPQKPTGRQMDTAAVMVVQVSAAIRSRAGRWWAVLEIHNHNKHDALSIGAITAQGYSRVLTSPATIPPHAKVRIPVVVTPTPDAEVAVASSLAAPTLVITFAPAGSVTYALQ